MISGITNVTFEMLQAIGVNKYSSCHPIPYIIMGEGESDKTMLELPKCVVFNALFS